MKIVCRPILLTAALRGSLIGAVGVSGVPGSKKGAACAAAALKMVEERLEFAL